MSYNPQLLREHFPQLKLKINDQDLIYFDNAASTLKHDKVVQRVSTYNSLEVANVHRGAHTLSRSGTEHYEAARESVRRFVNADSPREVIFTRGTTESINLVAASYGAEHLGEGDEIVISPFEHHSNIVPWQQISKKTGCQLKVMEFSREEGLTDQAIKKAITSKTKLVSVLWYSNSFGHRLPVEKVIAAAKGVGAKVMLDAAQVPLHERIDVQKLSCDFLAMSGHKMFGPYGIGALFAKSELLEKMPPYQTGGSMVDRVTFTKTTFADFPQKFEAGTPNISGAIGLAVACDLIMEFGVATWHKHLQNLRERVIKHLLTQKNIEVYDFPGSSHSSVVSFNYKGAHPTDVGALLDQWGIAIRAGHHCTQPCMELLGIEGTVRVSLAPYNTDQDVDKFCEAVVRLEEFF